MRNGTFTKSRCEWYFKWYSSSIQYTSVLTPVHFVLTQAKKIFNFKQSILIVTILFSHLSSNSNFFITFLEAFPAPFPFCFKTEIERCQQRVVKKKIVVFLAHARDRPNILKSSSVIKKKVVSEIHLSHQASRSRCETRNTISAFTIS